MDPFTLVYNALWDLAEASEEFTSLVKIGNRIKFNETRPSQPIKREISVADLPEVVLTSEGSRGNLHHTSSSSSIIRSYSWIVATGDMSITSKLLPVEWALFAAMTNWKTELASLRWPDDATDSFVKRMNLNSIDNGFSDAQRNRGIIGWSAVWSIEVEMHFRTSDLQAVGAPTTTSAPTTT